MNENYINKIEFPYLSQLEESFLGGQRFAVNGLHRAYSMFGNSWAKEFEKILSSLFSSKESINSAAKGYAKFAIHSMRLQAAFERDRQYKNKTHEQASQEVYFNETHMMEEYLPGLLLSHFLWPHHYRQLQFFESAFVQSMRVNGASSFIEVGIGTGLYSGFLLRKLPEIKGLGFDISPASKNFTETQMSTLGVADRYKVSLRDITFEPIQPTTDWLVCVEVLEHLDDPVAFLRGLKLNMAVGARAFITAAVNAAHTDHIYLYRNAGEVLVHLIEAGFTLEQSFVAAAYKPSSPGVPVPEAVAFIVY